MLWLYTILYTYYIYIYSHTYTIIHTYTIEVQVWVPCEFDVWSTQRVSLVGGDRSHLEPHLAEEAAACRFVAAMILGQCN